MRVEQFVFGRVSRGLRPVAGYQPAAASPALAEAAGVQRELERLSFYPSPARGRPARPRLAFARLEDGWVSLSRTAMARDLSGSVGYFAHHLVVRRDDILAAGCLPLPL